MDIHSLWVLFDRLCQQAGWLTGQSVRDGQSPVYRPFAQSTETVSCARGLAKNSAMAEALFGGMMSVIGIIIN